jgi:hypothetical protein
VHAQNAAAKAQNAATLAAQAAAAAEMLARERAYRSTCAVDSSADATASHADGSSHAVNTRKQRSHPSDAPRLRRIVEQQDARNDARPSQVRSVAQQPSKATHTLTPPTEVAHSHRQAPDPSHWAPQEAQVSALITDRQHSKHKQAQYMSGSGQPGAEQDVQFVQDEQAHSRQPWHAQPDRNEAAEGRAPQPMNELQQQARHVLASRENPQRHTSCGQSYDQDSDWAGQHASQEPPQRHSPEPGRHTHHYHHPHQADPHEAPPPIHTNVKIRADRVPDSCPFATDDLEPPAAARGAHRSTQQQPRVPVASAWQQEVSGHRTLANHQQQPPGTLHGYQHERHDAGAYRPQPHVVTNKDEFAGAQQSAHRGEAARVSCERRPGEQRSGAFMGALQSLKAGPSDAQRARAEEIRAQLKHDLQEQVRSRTDLLAPSSCLPLQAMLPCFES